MPPSRIIVFNAVLLCACLYALGRGGRPERWTAWMMAAAAALTASRPYLTSIDYDVFNPMVGSIDLAFLIGLTALAVRADRFWPMWAAVFQLIIMGVHGARVIDPHLLPSVYNRSMGKLAYPMIALLVVGTYRHHRRVNERDWSPMKW